MAELKNYEQTARMIILIREHKEDFMKMYCDTNPPCAKYCTRNGTCERDISECNLHNPEVTEEMCSNILKEEYMMAKLAGKIED